MRLYRQMILVLSSIGVISGALLTTVNLFTKDRIAANKQREIEAGIVRVVPGTKASQKIYEENDFTVYEGKDEEGLVLGVAVSTAVGGFQDKIVYIFGLNAELTRVSSLYVLEQKETPGLGAKITNEESFLQFWEERDCSQPITLRKPAVDKSQLAPSEVNTITGATISSRAVLTGVNAAVEKIKRLKQEGKLNAEGSHGE